MPKEDFTEGIAAFLDILGKSILSSREQGATSKAEREKEERASKQEREMVEFKAELDRQAAYEKSVSDAARGESEALLKHKLSQTGAQRRHEEALEKHWANLDKLARQRLDWTKEKGVPFKDRAKVYQDLIWSGAEAAGMDPSMGDVMDPTSYDEMFNLLLGGEEFAPIAEPIPGPPGPSGGRTFRLRRRPKGMGRKTMGQEFLEKTKPPWENPFRTK